MMELHEENKVMREALEIIASAYSTKCSIMAKEALAMIKRAKRSAQPEGGKQPSEAFAYVNHVVSKQFADGSLGKAIAAAQPEGRAAPVQHDSDCSLHNVGVPELLGPCDCSVTPAAQPEGGAAPSVGDALHSQRLEFLSTMQAYFDNAKAAIKRAEKAEAELASARAALAYTERQNGELETALAELHGKPAPQAGDALGEVVAGGRFVSNVEWFAGYMPPVGTKLYAAPPATAAPAKLMSVPQVADMLREKNLLTESGMKTFLNGDALRFHPADIARIINAAFATQQVPK